MSDDFWLYPFLQLYEHVVSTFPGQIPISPFGIVIFGQDLAVTGRGLFNMEKIMLLISYVQFCLMSF